MRFMTWNKIIVLETGSYLHRIGFAGDDKPLLEVPTVFGYTRDKEEAKYCFGNCAINNRDALNLVFPLHYGTKIPTQQEWDILGLLWGYLAQKLSNNTRLNIWPNYSQCKVLIVIPPFPPREFIDMYEDYFLGEFRADELLIMDSSKFPLYASGRTSGISVDIGSEVTYISGLIESELITEPIKHNIGGEAITNQLNQIFKTNQIVFSTERYPEVIIREIKEKKCFVPPETHLMQRREDERSEIYVFRDGEEINLDYQWLITPEIFFRPAAYGLNISSIQENIADLILSCDEKYQEDLISNIMISGSTTFFPGFRMRLWNELYYYLSKNGVYEPLLDKLRVFAGNEKGFARWKGAAIMATSSGKYIQRKFKNRIAHDHTVRFPFGYYEDYEFSEDIPPLYRYDIALSFAGEDRKIADALAHQLENKQLKVFYDYSQKAQLIGENLNKTLYDIYFKKAKYCIILLSNEYFNSDWAQFEYESIIRREEEGRDQHEFLIPLKLDDYKLGGFLKDIGYIDFEKENKDIELVIELILEKIDFKEM